MPGAKRSASQIAAGPTNKRPKRAEINGTDDSGTNSILSFLNLPGELRNHIYSCFLDEMTRGPYHVAYDPLPTHARFKGYYNLIWVNRQIQHEVESLFRCKYIKGLVFYFKDASICYDVQQAVSKSPMLDDVRFCFRASSDVPENTPRAWVSRSAQRLIDIQPEVLRRWGFEPGHRGVPPPWSGNAMDFNPNSDGFQRVEGNHSQCVSSKYCIPFVSLIYPKLANEMTMTVYSWSSVRSYRRQIRDASVEELSSTTLEGKLRDISTSSTPSNSGSPRRKLRGAPWSGARI